MRSWEQPFPGGLDHIEEPSGCELGLWVFGSSCLQTSQMSGWEDWSSSGEEHPILCPGGGPLVWGTYDSLFSAVSPKAWIEEHWALYGRLELERSLLSLSKLY